MIRFIVRYPNAIFHLGVIDRSRDVSYLGVANRYFDAWWSESEGSRQRRKARRRLR